jgi:hypothetical protein
MAYRTLRDSTQDVTKKRKIKHIWEMSEDTQSEWIRKKAFQVMHGWLGRSDFSQKISSKQDLKSKECHFFLVVSMVLFRAQARHIVGKNGCYGVVCIRVGSYSLGFLRNRTYFLLGNKSFSSRNDL